MALAASRPACIHSFKSHKSSFYVFRTCYQTGVPPWCRSPTNSNSPRTVTVTHVQASEVSDTVPRSKAITTASNSSSSINDLAGAAAAPGWSWGSVYDRDILALALPAALALAADPLLGMVDTALVGRLGADELAALGVNTSLFTLSFVVFNFLATATTPILATALGQRNSKAAGEVVWQATSLALLLGAGVAAGLWTHADLWLDWMGADASQGQHMHELALQYLVLRAAAAPAVLLVTVGQGVFRGLQNMRAPLLITLATNAVHLGLDLLLMFKLGLGIQGAAASTAASEWLAAGAYCWLVWQRRDVLGLWPPPRMPANQIKQRLMPFLQAGSAVVMRTGSLLGTKTLATAVAARLGPGAVASHQVLMQLWVLSSMLTDSLAVSGQTLIAVNLGQGQPGTARQISERLVQLGLGLGVGLAVLSGASAPWWPQLFTADDGILGQIHQLVPLAVLPLPVNALVYTLDGVLVGASDFGYLMAAMVGASAVAASMLVMVEPSGTGLQGVWTALAVLMVGRLATLGWRFQSANGPLPPLHLQRLQDEQPGQPQTGQQQHHEQLEQQQGAGDSSHTCRNSSSYGVVAAAGGGDLAANRGEGQRLTVMVGGHVAASCADCTEINTSRRGGGSSSTSSHGASGTSTGGSSSSSSSRLAAAEVMAPLLLLNNAVSSSSLRGKRQGAAVSRGVAAGAGSRGSTEAGGKRRNRSRSRRDVGK